MGNARGAIPNGSHGTGACSYRHADDDFFCLRYQVWYSSVDCAMRTRHETCGGCLACEQGRFNLKRHQASPRLSGLRPITVD